LLHKKNMFLSSYFCVLCVQNVEEDVWHLFFGCPFIDACWIFLGCCGIRVLIIKLWFSMQGYVLTQLSLERFSLLVAGLFGVIAMISSSTVFRYPFCYGRVSLSRSCRRLPYGLNRGLGTK
jgi:hypothetical protein